jgi:hypothetical protein
MMNFDYQANCSTPNNMTGTCIPFRICDVLFNLQQDKPVSPTSKKLIQDSKCSETADGKINVC